MPPDSRRQSPKLLPARTLSAEEPTLRDLRTLPEPPAKRVLPWMGLILFCTGAVFQAGRLVERLDPQPPHQSALTPGQLAVGLTGGVPHLVPAAREPLPEKPVVDAEALRKLMAERDEAHAQARAAWQKQVEAEVAAQVARLGEASSQQKQLEADEVARNATQAAAEAEAKARGLEVQLATKAAELQEAQLRTENAWLRAELERARGQKVEGLVPVKGAEAVEPPVAEGPRVEVQVEPPPPAPAAAMEAPASPVPAPLSPGSEPTLAPEPPPPAEAKPTTPLPGGA